MKDTLTEHYVTMMDSNFLPQGLALYESMANHIEQFALWILCLDDKVAKALQRLRKNNLRLIPLCQVETAEFLKVKKQRSLREYCWTLKPITPKTVFDQDLSVRRVTYLDADMWFFRSPDDIFNEFELSGKSVLITDHAFDAENDRSQTSGRYCAQLLIFVRNRSEHVRQWWEERCLEWCFARSEKGLFADQKYLDKWPSLFSRDVHVLQQLDLLLGPWNAQHFSSSRAIAWHFHGLRLLEGGTIELHPGYSLPREVESCVYSPYLQSLRQAVQQIGEPVIQESLAHYLHILPPRVRSILRQGLRLAGKLSCNRIP
jgi:hypothetical protein